MRMWEKHTKVGRTSFILLSQLLQRWEGHSQHLSHDILCFDAQTGVRNPNDKAGSDNGQDSAGVHSNFPEVSQSVCIAMHSHVICSLRPNMT